MDKILEGFIKILPRSLIYISTESREDFAEFLVSSWLVIQESCQQTLQGLVNILQKILQDHNLTC